MTADGQPANSPGDSRNISITAANGGVAAQHIGQVIIDGVAALKAATTVLPLEAMVADDLPFVGRGSELQQVAEVISGASGAAAGIVVIAGPPGVGKTSLMWQAATVARDAGHFSEVLFVDLRGYAESVDDRVQPEAVLSKLLILLGVDDDDVPLGPAAQAIAYQKRMNHLAAEGQSVLIWLDNASIRSQFDTLMPSNPAHMVAVTTRETFGHVPKTHVVEVDVMSPAEAVDVLISSTRQRNPDDFRLRDDPESAGHLAELCDHLPLALQIVAALLADEPDRPVPDLVEEMAAEESRLNSLEYDRDLSVRAAFTLSYKRLPNDLKRLFRLMSVVPGGDVGLVAASWLIAATQTAVRPQLMALVRSHLAQQHVRNRWSMHDLIRLYAKELSASDPDDSERALRELVKRYIVGVAAAAEWLTAVVSDTARKLFASPQQAAGWFEAERMTTIAIVKSLAERTDYRDWNLALAVVLGEILDSQRHWLNDSHDVAVVGASLVLGAQDRHQAGCVLNQYGSALRKMGEFDDALAAYRRAVEVAEDAGDFRVADAARGNMGNVYLEQGRPIDEVLDVYWQDVAACRESEPPNRHSEAVTLVNIGAALSMFERYAEAVPPLREAMELCRFLNDKPGIASAAKNLGAALSRLGRNEDNPSRLEEAIGLLEEAAEIYRERGNVSGWAEIVNNLGQAQCQLRLFDVGMPNLEAAVEYFERTGQTSLATQVREDIEAYRQDAARRRTWSAVSIGDDRYRFTNVSGSLLAQITVAPTDGTFVWVENSSEPYRVPASSVQDGGSFTAVIRGPGARINATMLPSMRTISITFRPV